MSISYIVQGRFANNLIQYFAAKVLGRITNKTYVYNKIDNSHQIGDLQFLDIYNSFTNNQSIGEFSDILLTEYYQQSDWIIREKEYLRSLLTVDNDDRINENYKISDIAKALKNFKSDQKDHELYIHVRLDDFIHNGYNSYIVDPLELVNYINTLGYKYHTIICDTLRADWEKKYINILTTSIPNLKITNNDLLTDFCLLYNSKNTLTSRSTLSWIACTISSYNYNTYMPLRHYRPGETQNIDKINENTVNFFPKYLLSIENLV